MSENCEMWLSEPAYSSVGNARSYLSIFFSDL
jgi:hypothetical protein